MLAVTPDDNALDAGPKSKSAGDERFCVVAREVKPASDLIRFVIDPEGAVVPDIRRRLPGRGLWVTGTRAAVTVAVQKRLFAKGFKRDVHIPADLADRTAALLERSALDALSIAGKAGEVVTGTSRVEVAIASARLAAILRASDAAANGGRKIDAALRRSWGEDAAKVPLVAGFTSAQLDLALGRSNVVHAALLAGPAGATFLARWARCDRYRTDAPDKRARL